MPAHMRPLHNDGPLVGFARELRALRDSARPPVPVRDIARPPGKYIPGDARYDRPAKQTIYAALSGKQLPTEETLEVMVLAWSGRGNDDLHGWRRRRRAVQEKLAATAAKPSTKPFSLKAEVIFQSLPKIIDHSAEAAIFHEKLLLAIGEKVESFDLLTVYPERTAHAVYFGYRLPSEDVLNDFLRIAKANDKDSDDLHVLWRRAKDSVGYIAAMAIMAGGQGLMGNAALKEVYVDDPKFG
ncbi:hypothetical protein [Amycolatopsis sp. NPDC059657]|uniref:hypothetical protein n=1 Tax=Amycolatopsis sp. NPDC059657 TaxID=3346899 RepID=UPI00366F22B8